MYSASRTHTIMSDLNQRENNCDTNGSQNSPVTWFMYQRAPIDSNAFPNFRLSPFVVPIQ